MPDGSHVPGLHAACRRWHEKLVEYGQVYLQSPSGQELGAQDDREPVPKPPWTGKQLAAAWETHKRVITLEPKARIVTQVYYRCRQAAYWDELEPDKQQEIQDELCREINVRYRKYCATVPQLAVTVRGYQIPGILVEAHRALVAQDVVAEQQANRSPL